ncbi:MAG: M20/M25/M40 family metallo-hydrolase [Planctomycetes bacterium]|nr:M20/M25/M40 family metallo-hydrolase [Planctomycetota bacterium]
MSDSAASVDSVLRLIVDIASVPAPPFAEENRHPLIRRLLSEWARGMPFAVDSAGNVVVWAEGGGRQPPLLVTAHLDTVFPDRSVAITQDDTWVCGPGVSDDASGVAAVLYLAQFLAGRMPSAGRGMILAFTVGEEGAGGLRGIKHIFAVLAGEERDPALETLLPGYAMRLPSAMVAVDGGLGSVVNRGLHVRRRRVSWKGDGGHSWGAAGTPSAIAAAARALAAISRIPARPGHTTVNVGVISGGTGVNSIAAECTADIEVRSVSGARAASVISRIEKIASEAAASAGLSIGVEVLDDRPGGVTRSSARVVKLLESELLRAGVPFSLAVSSTEANIAMAYRVPAVATGVVAAERTHTPDERFRRASLEKGLAVVRNYVSALLE